MRKIHFILFSISFIITCLIHSEIKAQDPVGTNGKFVTVKGLKVYYEVTGRGMPLILLHGFTNTASEWRVITPQLAKFYKVIAIDLPGHGRSDYMDTTDVYLHKRAAECILGVLDNLKIDSANVVGISAGGIITLYMATLKPQLTKKIIIISGHLYISNITRNFLASEGPGWESPEFLKEMIQAHGKQKGMLILRQFWNFRKLYGDPSFTPDELSTITAKTLIMHGDADPIAPVTHAWEMYQSIPKAHLWIVPNGGHVPTEDPANRDDFLRRMLEFLRGEWKDKK